MRRAAALVVLVVSLALPGSALAAGQLPITQMTPAQSTNLPPGSTPTFHVETSCKGQQISVVVANQSVYDAEGKLLASAQVDTFQLSETATNSGVYEGSTRSTWLQTPGTYFWQAVTVANCDANIGATLQLLSPAVAIIVTAAMPGSGGDGTPTEVEDDADILTLSQAKAALPNVIRKGTRRTGRKVAGRCTRRGSGSILVVFCTTRWSDGKKWAYNGSIRQALNDDGTISARFDGRRATLACIKKTQRKVDEKRCFKRFRFSAEV